MPHACITVVLMLLNCWSSPLICSAGLYGRQKHSGCAQGQPLVRMRKAARVWWHSRNTRVLVSSCAATQSSARACQALNPRVSSCFTKHWAICCLPHQSYGGVNLPFCAQIQSISVPGAGTANTRYCIVKKDECCEEECVSSLSQPMWKASSLLFCVCFQESVYRTLVFQNSYAQTVPTHSCWYNKSKHHLKTSKTPNTNSIRSVLSWLLQ